MFRIRDSVDMKISLIQLRAKPLIFQGFFLFTRITGQSPHLRETLATVAIIRGNSRSVFSFV